VFVTPRPSHRPRQYSVAPIRGENKAASAYGTFVAASDTSPKKMVHGTFLISPEGTVEWANTGNEPFVDNKSLLRSMAEVTSAWSPCFQHV